MSFKVRIRLVEVKGNKKKYPCHFGHKVGDEVIFDGEKFIGKMCPSVWEMVVPKVIAVHRAGPRYVDPLYYSCFLYECYNVRFADNKPADGVGFKNVFEKPSEPKYHMQDITYGTALRDMNNWPPLTERTIAREIGVICPDSRVANVFAVEAFDLCDVGEQNIPFFRRQMVILDRVAKKSVMAVDEILDEFSEHEKLDIFPALHAVLVDCLVDELELVGLLEREESKVEVTSKGMKRLAEFKAGLTAEERKALSV